MQKKKKKLKSSNAMTFDDTWKISFWTHFRPLLALKPQNKIFAKKSFKVNF